MRFHLFQPRFHCFSLKSPLLRSPSQFFFRSFPFPRLQFFSSFSSSSSSSSPSSSSSSSSSIISWLERLGRKRKELVQAVQEAKILADTDVALNASKDNYRRIVASSGSELRFHGMSLDTRAVVGDSILLSGDSYVTGYVRGQKISIVDARQTVVGGIDAKSFTLRGNATVTYGLKAETVDVDGELSVQKELECKGLRLRGKINVSENLVGEDIEISVGEGSSRVLNLFGSHCVRISCMHNHAYASRPTPRKPSPSHITALATSHPFAEEYISSLAKTNLAPLELHRVHTNEEEEGDHPPVLHKPRSTLDSDPSSFVKVDVIVGGDVHVDHVTALRVKGKRVSLGRYAKVQTVEFSEQLAVHKNARFENFLHVPDLKIGTHHFL